MLSALMLAGNLAQGANYQSTVLADSPAGYWRLGDALTTVADGYMATNIGTLGADANGVFTHVGRQEPGALIGSADKANRFWDASASRIVCGSKASFNFTGTMPFTLEVWAKPLTTGSGTRRLISNGSAGMGYAFSIRNGNLLRLTALGVADVDSSTTYAFAVDQWYHLAVVRSDTLLYFYVNGTQLGSARSLANVKTSTDELAFGRAPGGTGTEGFTGYLDEPAVYTNALTATQIAAHYNAGINNAAGYEALILADKPIGYWRLNEPGKVESTSTIANSGSLGSAAQGSVIGAMGSLVPGATGALTGDADTAVGYPGPDGMIDVPFNSALHTPSFTVECWAKMDTWAAAHISPLTSRESGASGTRGFMLYAAPISSRPRWEFWTGTGTGFNTANAGEADVATNKWTHLVGTYDADSKVMALYVDGKLARGLINATYSPNTATPIRIGAGSTETPFGQYWWRGALDEVAVYPTALTPQRVQAHYEAATGSSPLLTAAPGLQAQPQSQTNWAPYPITVSCVVTGSLPMQFQWYQVTPDGLTTNAVPNATNMVLKLDPTNPAQNGNYYLAATNGLGGTESTWAYVEVWPIALPTFTIDAPATVPVYNGGAAGVPLVAEGTPTITYQWKSNNVNIANATNAILRVPQVQPSYASAVFQATLSNPGGTVQSAPAQLSVLTAPPLTYAAVATGLNPLAYWRLGEGLPPVAFDYWGGHPAYFVNAAQDAPGALVDDDDGAATTYGTGSYVRTLEMAPFNFTGTQSFTLAAWVKVDSFPASGAARIFSNRRMTSGTGGYGLGFIANNTLRFTSYGLKDVNASVPSFAVGQWYHIAAVRNNAAVYLYIDGVMKNSDPAVANINPSIYPLQLGGNPNFSATTDEEPFMGTIDEAAVFDRALTASEISALFASRYGSLVPPTIAREPVSALAYVGGTARFSVVAEGSQPLSYQWKADGSPITGATTSTLVLSGLTLANNGVNYSVTINNNAGSITSANALLTVQQPAGYPAAVVADGPVALWRLGESSGPVAHDSWGGYNGFDNGGVIYGSGGAVAADANTSASFDGVFSKIDVPYTAALNPAVFTMEAWAKVTGGQGTYRCVMATRDQVLDASQRGGIIYATDGNFWSFWTGTDGGWATLNGPSVVTNKWTHLVAVFDGQNKYLYVDGVLANTVQASMTPNTVRPLRIGAGRNELDAGDYFFAGDIDEVAVYDKALTADRVGYHYGMGKYGPNAAPIIERQPFSLTVAEGNTALFYVQAGGTPVLGYQWLHNGSPLPGATTATLTLSDVRFANAGSYRARVTNAIGTTESAIATLAVGGPPTYANLTNELVLHLKFEDDVLDASGRNNHGTAIGAPTFVPGRLGKALHYSTDATTPAYNYVTLGTPADLLFSSNVNFSVSYWVRFTGSPGDLPFIGNAYYSYSNPGWVFAPGYNSGTWSYSMVGDQGSVLTGYAREVINDGQWHNLVHTVDRAGMALTFLDGAFVDMRWIDGVGDIDTGLPVTIGQDTTGVYPETAAGDIDDIAIWRKALTAYDAQCIYAAAVYANQSIDVVGPVRLQIRPVGAELEISWQSGVLQESTTLNGTYTPVPGASAPAYRFTPGPGDKFYRVMP